MSTQSQLHALEDQRSLHKQWKLNLSSAQSPISPRSSRQNNVLANPSFRFKRGAQLPATKSVELVIKSDELNAAMLGKTSDV